MPELLNFIPRTANECRELVKDIDGKSSATLTDRYGNTEELSADNIGELVKLIKDQIGEKSPQKDAKEKKEEVIHPNAKTPAKTAKSTKNKKGQK